MLFKHLLQELGASVGLEGLAPDADGSCSLLFDGEHELTFTPDDSEEAVFVYVHVADRDVLQEDTARALLAASCLGAETDGAAFGLHGDSLILWRHYEGFTDLSALQKAVNALLAKVVEWKEKLTSPASPATEQGPQTPRAPERIYGLKI